MNLKACLLDRRFRSRHIVFLDSVIVLRLGIRIRISRSGMAFAVHGMVLVVQSLVLVDAAWKCIICTCTLFYSA